MAKKTSSKIARTSKGHKKPRERAEQNRIKSTTGVPKGQLHIERANKGYVAPKIDRYPYMGRPKAFQTPEELWEAFVEYFNWNRNNPLYTTKPMLEDGIIVLQQVPLKRLPSLEAFCLFCGHNTDLLAGMRRNDFREREKFGEVIKSMTQAIASEQIEGASVDLFNHNIVSRLQGLKERVDHTSNEEAIPTPTIQVYNSGPGFSSSEKDVDVGNKK